MELFSNLSQDEQDQLLKFPAYIALLAANLDGELDAEEKNAAIELTHIRSYKSDEALSGFYKEVEKNFEKTIIAIDAQLPKDKKSRETEIMANLDKLELILSKLGYSYSKKMHESMRTFKNHVSDAHGNVLERFVIPIPIKGITE